MKVQYEILFALMSGERLSVQKAFRLFHTTELRKVVSRLRRRGYDIRSEKRAGQTLDGRTVTYNEYYLAHEN
jgi:biotin operon repressor